MILKVTINFLLLFFFSSIIIAQTITWQKLYSDKPSFHDGYSIIQLQDEGYIAVGEKNTTQGFKIVAMRLDKYGNLIWRNYYPGLNPKVIVATYDGNYLIGADNLTKIDLNGGVIWTRPEMIYNIELTNDGGFYTCGGINNPILKKYDSLGYLQWQKIYDSIPNGGFNNCLLREDGFLVLIGNYHQNDFPFIMKTDLIGNLIWIRQYNNDSLRFNYLYNIEQNLNGDYMVSGYNISCYFIKFDSLGNWQSINFYPSTVSNRGTLNGLIKTADDGFALTGYYKANDTSYFVRLIKTDFEGKKEWIKLYGIGQSSNGRNLKQTSDSGFIIIGRKDTSSLISDIYIIKTDKIGNTSPFVNITPISNIIPSRFVLHQNYPNPFNPYTNINFELQKVSNITLIIYNSRGQEIIKLISTRLNPGKYSIPFIPNNKIPSGIYFYSLKSEHFFEVKKMMLINRQIAKIS